MTDNDEGKKVVRLYRPLERAGNQEDHPVSLALKRAGPIAKAPKPQAPDPYADRRPNRLAIGALTGLSVISFLAAYLTPATADNGVKFGAAMAMVWGIITMAGALLCRYGREFWISRDQ